MIEIIETVNNGLEDCYKCYDPEFQIYEKTTGYYYNAPDVNYYIYLPVRRFNELEESNIPVEPIEPVVEKYVMLSTDDGHTYEQAFLSENYIDNMTFENAVDNDVTINGLMLGWVNDEMQLDKKPLYYEDGTKVLKNNTIIIGEKYILGV